MKACVTGATGFLGGHVVRLLAERGDEVRVSYRDPERLERLAGLEVKPVKADILDRAGMRRALRGTELAFHTAGFVGSRPADRVWQINALSPRVVVEAAAAEGVRRVVVTSSVAALGPAPEGEIGDESQLYRGGGLGLTYANAKHEGEREAFLAGARLGVEVVVTNPSYVFGVPVDRSQPGETSTRIVANYLRGRLPAVVDGEINAVDVEDVAAGHLLAAERGAPSERYMLGAHNVSWVELIDRVAKLSGVRQLVVVLPPELALVARIREGLGLPGPIAAEGYVLMGQNWRYSSRKPSESSASRRARSTRRSRPPSSGTARSWPWVPLSRRGARRCHSRRAACDWRGGWGAARRCEPPNGPLAGGSWPGSGADADARLAHTASRGRRRGKPLGDGEQAGLLLAVEVADESLGHARVELPAG